MTNIFNFPPKKGEVAEGDFLHDANELLQFDAAGRDVNLFKPGSAGATSTQPTPPLSKDWSNQELASIYRVKRLLDAAGVPNHIERSLSDEGDPWCVFCGAAGEVFIHLCRIDGFYVLDSPNLAQPIYGRDFTDLIEKFSDGALRDSDKASKVRRRLIKLERGGKVFLHPAALLAALIWSIYLNSEDLVLFVPEDEEALDEEDALALVADAADASDADDAALEAEFIAATASPDEVVSSQTLAEVNGTGGYDKAAGTPFYKDLFGKAGLALAPSGMAVGLSTIAIAYGFISESYFEDDAEDLAALGLTEDGTVAAKLDDAETAENQTPATRSFDLVAALDAVFDPAGGAAQNGETVLPEGSAQIDISGLLDMTLTPPTVGSSGPDFVQPGTDGANAAPDNLVSPEQPLTLETDPAVIIAASDAPDGTDDVILADVVAPIAQDFFSIADLRDSLSNRLTEFFVGETRFEASFDIAELSVESSRIIEATLADDDPFVATSSMSTAAAVPIEDQVDYVPIEVFYAESEADVIDRKAFSFVNYLMNKDSDVQVIARDNEIVLIDFAAFGTSNDQAYSMSWNLEHGGTVQTIGLRSEFMEFDLIA